MNQQIETRAEAWERRAAMRGQVDFTMMYVGHDAFCRDLDRLHAAADAGVLGGPAAQRSWRLFSRMLHVHHTAEDRALWPALREAVTLPEDIAVLTAMEAEHAAIDPLVEGVTAAVESGGADITANRVEALARMLRGHMLHEENEALPLLERVLGTAGWVAFGRETRRQMGLADVAVMLPWVLDGASEPSTRTVLGMMPAPLRMLYRHVWAPRYRRESLLAMVGDL